MTTEREFRFQKSQRLRTSAEFARVYASHAFAADDVLVVKLVENELAWSRLGVSVSKKVGNAVVRNRWKRLLREAFRQAQHELPPGLDLVLRPKAKATPDFNAIRQSLARLVRRAVRKLPRR